MLGKVQFYNNQFQYGGVSILFHWLIAILMIFLFVLGEVMTELPYNHPWVHDLTALHESFGIAVFLLAVGQLVWIRFDSLPGPLPSLNLWEWKVARRVHWVLLGMTLLLPVSGYVLSTSTGQVIEWFGFLEIPPVLPGSEELNVLASDVHAFLAYLTAGLVGLHIAAALKHHFWNQDATLRRMLGLHINHRGEKT